MSHFALILIGMKISPDNPIELLSFSIQSRHLRTVPVLACILGGERGSDKEVGGNPYPNTHFLVVHSDPRLSDLEGWGSSVTPLHENEG